MWGVVAAAAISVYAANGGKLSGWNIETEDDWMAMEKKRMKRLRHEARATRLQALLGAVLLIALAASVAYMVAA